MCPGVNTQCLKTPQVELLWVAWVRFENDLCLCGGVAVLVGGVGLLGGDGVFGGVVMCM